MYEAYFMRTVCTVQVFPVDRNERERARESSGTSDKITKEEEGEGKSRGNKRREIQDDVTTAEEESTRERQIE